MLEIVEATGLLTLQDQGRLGWRRYGVPASGPMDPFAFAAANMLAGNAPEAAELEIGGGEIALRAASECVIAMAGTGYKLRVNTWEYPLWGSYFVRGGWTLRLERAGFGMRAYLALAGGIEAALVLGSRSTYLRGRFGGLEGRRLEAGDVLKGAMPGYGLIESAGRTLAPEAQPVYAANPTVEITPGPQQAAFTDEGLNTLLSNAYRVGLASDRMGYRLEGPTLKHRRSADLTSEGMAVGSIQVPADGAPIVMMSDCATTGGYPKIGCVIRADLPLLAQCTPGKDQVEFRETTVEAAQEKYRAAVKRIKSGIRQNDEGAEPIGAG
jgi:antagonist of KipI